MSDLSRIVDEMCAWLDGVETAPLSISVETLSTRENSQNIVIASNFHSFHSFHAEHERLSSGDLTETETPLFLAAASRVTSSCGGNVEIVERVERGVEKPAETTLPLFPLSLDEMERVERAGNGCGSFLPDLAPPPGDPLPITAADVRAGVARELRALAEDGREGPAALRDAVEITRAKIRNSEALAERQAHGGRCHVCDGPLDDSAPVVAVLSWSRGGPLHLHVGCCAAYNARRVALVDRIMATAGYGAEVKGEVA